VDTTKILNFRHASQAELLLESLIRDRLRADSPAHIVTDRSGLPAALQRVLIEAGRSGKTWRAWSDGRSTCGYTGEMLAARLNGVKCAVLRVTSYDHRGRLTSQRTWARRGWVLADVCQKNQPWTGPGAMAGPGLIEPGFAL
jgi:hypothetical protein